MALTSAQRKILRNALADKDAADAVADAIDAGSNTPAADVADVASADADATYGAPEAALINELKAQVNELFANMRSAGLME